MKLIKLLLIRIKTNFRNYRLRKLLLFLGLTIFSFSIILNSPFVSAQLISENPSQEILRENMSKMEQNMENDYSNFFQKKVFNNNESALEMASTLNKIDKKTGTKSAVFWVMPEEKYLHLVFLTGKGKIIIRDLNDVPLSRITKVVKDFYAEIDQVNNPINLTQAKQLYDWIITPFEKNFLEAENIDNLLFCLGNGVRLLPLSALHDGKNFLVEKYNTTRIPAFNLINPQYESLKTPTVLAMGASSFPDNSPLPAVTLELQNIIKRLPSSSQASQVLLNEEFTFRNMEEELQGNSFNIIHLATHANFNPGDTTNSYIQFWDQKLTLEEMSNFSWQTPPDLLVLSACNTALGDRNSELGFTGIALQTGVKSALGSLWSVSDLGTFALITEFYEQLINQSEQNPTKTQALRQAQNLLLQEKIYFQDNRLITPHGDIELPEDLGLEGKVTLSHPFYWAGFTLISSPW
jgi:CHAT domain-containing protein